MNGATSEATHPAGFWIRLVAFALDLVVIALAQFVLQVVAAVRFGPSGPPSLVVAREGDEGLAHVARVATDDDARAIFLLRDNMSSDAAYRAADIGMGKVVGDDGAPPRGAEFDLT